MASPPARISPRTTLPFLSLPSHSKTRSLMFFAATAVAIVVPRECSLALRLSRSLVGHRDHFFERRHAAADLDQAGLAQVTHTFAIGLGGEVDRRALGEDKPLDLLGDGHDLIDAHATLVAVGAGRAAHRAIRLPATVQIGL